jgi:hypothetical protein
MPHVLSLPPGNRRRLLRESADRLPLVQRGRDPFRPGRRGGLVRSAAASTSQQSPSSFARPRACRNCGDTSPPLYKGDPPTPAPPIDRGRTWPGLAEIQWGDSSGDPPWAGVQGFLASRSGSRHPFPDGQAFDLKGSTDARRTPCRARVRWQPGPPSGQRDAAIHPAETQSQRMHPPSHPACRRFPGQSAGFVARRTADPSRNHFPHGLYQLTNR